MHAFWYTALFALVSLIAINLFAFAIAYALTGNAEVAEGQKQPLEEGVQAVSYTHLDVYKRQTGRGYTALWPGSWTGRIRLNKGLSLIHIC